MVTIILERTMGNEWEIKSEKGNTLCRRNYSSVDDAVKWCENYMTSFQISYEIKIVDNKR